MDDRLWWRFFDQRLATLYARRVASQTHIAAHTGLRTVACQQRAVEMERRVRWLLVQVAQMQQSTRTDHGEPVGAFVSSGQPASRA